MIGIVDTCTDVIPFVSRTSNRDSKRRELTIIDEDTSMSVTLWDDQVTYTIVRRSPSEDAFSLKAENFDEELAENKAVVAFQRIRVAIYNNSKSLRRAVQSIENSLFVFSRVRTIRSSKYGDESQSRSVQRQTFENLVRCWRSTERQSNEKQHSSSN